MEKHRHPTCKKIASGKYKYRSYIIYRIAGVSSKYNGTWNWSTSFMGGDRTSLDGNTLKEVKESIDRHIDKVF